MADSSSSGLIFNNTIVNSGNRTSMGMGGILLDQETHDMNVSTNNITTSGYDVAAIWIWGDNSTIENNILNSSGEVGDGIYLNGVQGINITSNTINISGDIGYGIHSDMSEDSTLPLLFYNNLIKTYGNYSNGINLNQESNNNISSNNITTSGSYSYGIFFNQSHNTTIANNRVTTGKTDSYVLYLITSANETFYNNVFNTSTSDSGLYVETSDLSYFNTTKIAATNIIKRGYIGGNFWTNNASTGYSDTCIENDGDYICDSAYTLTEGTDYLPLSDYTTYATWEFNGTVRNVDGTLLNNTLVNITMWTMGATGMTYIGSNSTNSFANGSFHLRTTENSDWMYKLVITHTNETTGAIDYIGQSLPPFPYAEFSTLSNISFYLREAGTFNITAVNLTGVAKAFFYIIKDTALGYPIAEQFTNTVTEAVVYVPRDRNYSIQIFPDQGMPITYNWNNFTAISDYNITTPSNTINLSNYSAANHTLKKLFNCSETLIWVSGYGLNSTGETGGYDEFNVVPLLLEGGDMVYLGDNADMPYNMSAWRRNETGVPIWMDNYSVNTGFYNISLPGPAESLNYILFATARNGTSYYGGYRNISFNFTSEDTEVNFTMYPLMSTDWGSSTSNITMKDAGSWQNLNISSAKMQFNLVNSTTNATLSSVQAHVEVTVDYTNYNATEFTFMLDVSQTGTASFYVPLINSTGVKEINIYSQSFSPKTVLARTPAQLIANSNTTMAEFNPGGINETISQSSIQVGLYKSNTTCNLPNPPASCIIADSASMDPTAANAFNPLTSIIGGGKLNFRMGLLSSGIIVEYINVDMLASGPPDAMFDNSATTHTSGGFDSAMRFGSNGPTIYDYALISMPYTEGSSSTTGLNETADVNMSIPVFYDESWNVIWNATATNNGTNGTNLAGNYSHYSTHSTEWETLMGENNCTRTQSELNSTKPCYIDTTNNRIWIRIPHFSGTQPSVTGSVVTATVAAPITNNPQAGGTTAEFFWTKGTVVVGENQFAQGYSKEIAAKQRLKVNISGVNHYVGVVSLTSKAAVINVSSNPQQKTLAIGEEWKVDVTEDGYYDILIKLNGIIGEKANLTIGKIYEKIIAVTAGNESPSGGITADAANEPETNPETTESSFWKSLLIVLVIVAVVIIFIAVYLVRKKHKKKRYYLYGY